MNDHQMVEEYINKHPNWKRELSMLRDLMSGTEMTETFKWGIPVYTIDNKNVLGIGAFKAYAGIWFYNGVFLKDNKKVLLNAQEGKTKGMRQWRFSAIEALDLALIKVYVDEAIANQKAGKEFHFEKKPLVIPYELDEELRSNSQLHEAFDALTLTRKREYIEYITEAKRDATKQQRMQKIKPMILKGIGLNDKYR